MSDHCYIGPLGLHTWNYERTECIWCGPGTLATKPGRWVDIGDGMSAWSAEQPPADHGDGSGAGGLEGGEGV